MSCKRKWHCLLLWIWGGGVGVKQISNSLLSFPIILLLPIYLFISTVFLFFLFSMFNCSLSPLLNSNRKDCFAFLILLLSISKFHIIYTYQPLLNTIFIGIYKWQGEDKLAWGQIWQKKKNSPIISKAQASNWQKRKTLLGQNCLSQPENARRRKTWGLLQP